MITIFGHHGVTDYDTWKKFFDAIPEEHYAKYKIVGTNVYRTPDGSAVIVMHTFNTLEDAQTHKQMMESAPPASYEEIGIIPPLTYWIAEEV